MHKVKKKDEEVKVPPVPAKYQFINTQPSVVEIKETSSKKIFGQICGEIQKAFSDYSMIRKQDLYTQCKLLKEYLADENFAEFKQELDAKQLESHPESNLISQAQVFDVLIKCWFQSEHNKLIIHGSIPESIVSDVQDSFYRYTTLLVEAMNKADVKEVTANNKEIIEFFFKPNEQDKGMICCREACPILSDGKTIRFINKNLFDYFWTKMIFDESVAHTESQLKPL